MASRAWVVSWSGLGAIAAVAWCLGLVQPARAEPAAPREGQPGKDVIWLPTPDEMVEKMLDVAQVARGERLVDLGSGDGKIVIAAARRGVLAKGIEFNPDMVEHSRRRAGQAAVQAEFVQGDIFASDFSNADVVTLYLLEHLNERLRPTLLSMKPGTRIVSYRFGMGAWEPDTKIEGDHYFAYMWVVPAKIEGEWGGRAGPLREAIIRGPAVSFTATDAGGASHRIASRPLPTTTGR